MKPRHIAALVAFLVMTPLLVTPAAAYYFDLQDFETDKLVYEVGETVNMAASLIADFGTSGWCRLTFGFVSDQGPVFAEEYNVTPSTQLRVFNSCYVLHPDDTSPGSTGTQGYAIFNAEIYDTISESDGRNIEVTITRGHLTAIPLSSMTVNHGTNTTLTFKVASVHTPDITLDDGIATVHIRDDQGQLVALLNETVTPEGLTNVSWDESYGPPGDYELTIHTEANDDFLELNATLPVTVIPEASYLNVAESPESAHCQSPDGTIFDTILVKVAHTDILGVPVIGSSVGWNTTSDYGPMTHEGGGVYSSWIPARLAPGLHNLTVTANHSEYQMAILQIPLTLLPNSVVLQTSVESPNVTEGGLLRFNVTATEEVGWNQPILLELDDGMGEVSFALTVNPGETAILTHDLEDGVSVGSHTLSITPKTEFYSVTGGANLTFFLIGFMTLDAVFGEAFYSEELGFNLTVLDSSNETVDSVVCSLLLYNEVEPFYVSGLLNPNESQSVPLPSYVGPGLHNITVVVSSPYYHQVSISTQITVWMRTNLSIVIEGSSLASAINQPLNLLWFNHEASSNLVQRKDLYRVTNRSTDFSRKLTEIEFRHNNLVYGFGECPNLFVWKGPQGPESQRSDINP